MVAGMKNVNEATKDEIGDIPFIGTERAEMIVHYREVHGPFNSVRDVAKVTGINERLAERVAEYFTFPDEIEEETKEETKSSTQRKTAQTKK